MHHLTAIRRVALGAALAGSAVALVPSMASAASSCTFNQTTRTMTVTNDAGGAPMTLRNSNTLTFRDGSSFNRSCFSPAGIAASSFNTSKILVRTSSPTAFQDTVIDESNNGRFETVTGARMSITVLTGTGNDHLDVRMGTGLDVVRLRSGGSGLSIGPSLDLNGDGVVDVGMTIAGLVTVDGGGGSDLLDGTGVNTFQLELKGGVTGNDSLRGGLKTDLLQGGSGNDTITSRGDDTRDFVDGGSDHDRSLADFRDSVINVEDQD
jgi:Ca2+-binding RTX toxin-like protein